MGQQAALYCGALVRTQLPVRLVPTRFADFRNDDWQLAFNPWDPYRSLLLTELIDDYINVVCGQPHDWQRFHTSNKRNVLMLVEENLSSMDEPALMELCEATLRYDIVCAPSERLAQLVEQHTGRRPVIVPYDGTPDLSSPLEQP